MGFYFPVFEIPLLVFGIVLWILCCYFANQRREAEGWPLRTTISPSVYIIPFYEQRGDEEVMDVYESYVQPPYRDPPIYCSRSVTPPPPYWLERTSYLDSTASYTDPPAYSEHQ